MKGTKKKRRTNEQETEPIEQDEVVRKYLHPQGVPRPETGEDMRQDPLISYEKAPTLI